MTLPHVQKRIIGITLQPKTYFLSHLSDGPPASNWSRRPMLLLAIWNDNSAAKVPTYKATMCGHERNKNDV